jgi:hypothetical protein
MEDVVDHQKNFWDLYVGIPSFVNDAQILRMFYLYHRTIEQNVFTIELGQEGVKPYILGGKDYPLLSWLMVPHKQIRVHQTMLKVFYN